jgi:arylsulfatase
MTGRHPIRSGTTRVVWGVDYGMVSWEKTMAELFSGVGYATGMFGKWHIGDQPGRWPTDQGFDEWYGVTNTTDESMYTSQPHYDPKVVKPPQIVEAKRGQKPKPVKEYNLETRRTIDRELNERAIKFMEHQAKAKKPFFVYIPYTAAHVPVLPHPDFEGKTGNGNHADMLAEMDFNVGQILDTLDRLDISENTVVVWMSENGPEEAPSYHGTAGPWRGHYFTTLEGSLRTSFLIRWPGNIKPGSVTNEIVHITDLLPTFGKIAGFKTPTDRMIDGVDQLPLFTGETKKSAREGFPAYTGDVMQSYKWRNFKVHYWKQDSMFEPPTKHNFPHIHDLLKDPKEKYGLYGGHGASSTGTEQLTWVLPAVTFEILKFKKTLREEPPIPFGTPEPYIPPK